MANARRVAVGRGWLPLLLACACAGLLAAGCAKPRAETLLAGPPLDVPAPPPRVLAPLELEAISATAGAPPAGAPEVTPGTGVSEPENPPVAAAKPAPAPAPAAPEQPEPTAAANDAPRELRIVPSVDDAALEQQLRSAMTNARRDLARVEYQRLSANAKAHYDQARRHLEQAERALKDRNLPYALQLAQTSATAASQLPFAR